MRFDIMVFNSSLYLWLKFTLQFLWSKAYKDYIYTNFVYCNKSNNYECIKQIAIKKWILTVAYIKGGVSV